MNLFNASEFREVVSGRRRGLAATALRGLLRLAEMPYAWEVRRRNLAFDTARRIPHRAGVPVVSVGNLTLGGTGKTPLVVWLAEWFAGRGLKVALVSRGYKAAHGTLNDEGRELAQKLPGVPHVQNPDRVAAAQKAVSEYGAELIVLDDGFQHRRLARDLDIVLIDALEPFGFGHVFPRGTLREPLAGLKRAQAAVLTRADMVDEAERTRIHSVVVQYAPGIAWATCRHAPQTLLNSSGTREPIAALAGRRVAALCGIGNPTGFRHTLAACGCHVAAWREFPDHHAYSSADLEQLQQWAAGSNCDTVVCTHKDLVKLAVDSLDQKPLWAVCVGMEFLEGRDGLEQQLCQLLEKQQFPQKQR